MILKKFLSFFEFLKEILEKNSRARKNLRKNSKKISESKIQENPQAGKKIQKKF